MVGFPAGLVLVNQVNILARNGEMEIFSSELLQRVLVAGECGDGAVHSHYFLLKPANLGLLTADFDFGGYPCEEIAAGVDAQQQKEEQENRDKSCFPAFQIFFPRIAATLFKHSAKLRKKRYLCEDILF